MPPYSYHALTVALCTATTAHWLLGPLPSHTTSSLTQVPQTSGSLPRHALRVAAISRLSIRLLLPRSIAVPRRSRSLTAVVKPADHLQRMSSKWLASRSIARSLVSSLNHFSCLLSVTIPSAVCNEISSGLLSAPVSGLMGLAWQALASSRAVPFWQSLYQGNVLDEPLMAFYLTRFQNDTNAASEEPGGVFTLGLSKHPSAMLLGLLFMAGTTNTSLYTGQIDYQSIPSDAILYWTLPLTSLTVNSASITLPSGSSSYAAIDTGTTLIGGPAAQVAALYAQIPNSAAASGNYQGYYTYRTLLHLSPPGGIFCYWVY